MYRSRSLSSDRSRSAGQPTRLPIEKPSCQVMNGLPCSTTSRPIRSQVSRRLTSAAMDVGCDKADRIDGEHGGAEQVCFAGRHVVENRRRQSRVFGIESRRAGRVIHRIVDAGAVAPGPRLLGQGKPGHCVVGIEARPLRCIDRLALRRALGARARRVGPGVDGRGDGRRRDARQGIAMRFGRLQVGLEQAPSFAQLSGRAALPV